MARFDAEARALERIGAPAVPRLIRRGETTDRRPFLVMERLRGQDLGAWLAARTELPPASVWLPLARGLGDALAGVHRAGLVHRDLKPENVFVRDVGAVALLDLGLVAGIGGPGITRSGGIVGTSTYVAPEQLRGEAVGPGADLYALGVILYELCTLRVPFVGDAAEIEHAHLVRRPAPPSDHVAAAAPYDAVILDCLAKDPGRRPATVNDVMTRLAAEPHLTAATNRRDHGVQATLRTQGQRPVALVGLAGARVDEVSELARRHGATIARVTRDRCLLAVIDGDAPLDQALAIAVAAAPRVATAVVHLAAARVRVEPGRREPRLFGVALDDLDGWWPRGPAAGVLITATAAPAMSHRLRPSIVAGFFEPDVNGDGGARVFGRDSEREQLAAALAGAAPGPDLVTVVGGVGIGKSTLARLAVDLAAARVGAARVVVDHARRRTAGRDGLIELAAAVLRHAVPGVSDPAMACERLLGDRDGALAWSAVAAAATERRQLDAARALASILMATARAAPLVVVVDDAHAAEVEVLDAIELATVGSPATPLVVVVLATPRLLDLRPRWGTRAHRPTTISIGPLPAETGTALLASLLAPATRIPIETLDRLAQWAGGVPQQLVDLARALRHAGAIRQHPGSDEWYLAGDHLDELPPSANAQWLAGRELALLAPELAELAQVGAVLGDDFELDEVVAVQGACNLARHVDARAGLDQLVRTALLTVSDGSYRFRQPSLQEACYALTAADARLAIHDRAFRHWLSAPRAGATLRATRIAHHGARSGHTTEARGCHLALAAEAARRHAYREAEQHYGHALDLTGDDDRHLRLHALAARGAIRRHLTHYEQARADLVAARVLASAIGDPLAVVELLVAESAVCDFLQRYGEAAELAEAASRQAASGIPPPLQARLCNWLGVARFHQQRDAEAVELLGLAIALGAALGDHESEIGASLILAHAFVRLGRAQDGLALLDRVIARCRAVGDYFHLACAHSNRVVVWRELGESDRATADLETVVTIARDFGFALLEAAGLANLAEHLCWHGRVDDAIAASEAAHRQSVRRFRDQPLALVSLYHAQLLALAGRDDDARTTLHELGTVDLTEPSIALMYDAVALALAGVEAGWDQLHARAEALAGGLQPVEMLWLEGRCAQRRGAHARARDRLDRAAMAARDAAPQMAAVIARDLSAAMAPSESNDRLGDRLAGRDTVR